MFFTLLSCVWTNAQTTLSGYVFLDENTNGVMDKGEKGVGGVLVSNQIEIVTTNASGKYEINTEQNPYVFVIKPADYDFSSSWADGFYVDARDAGIVKQLPYPSLHLFGNHDIDEKALSAEKAAGIFKRHYGPDYYSFNEGNVHFVALNNVLYEGWDAKNNKHGNYFGGLTATQYQWLEADLKHVGQETLIVIQSHIPFREEYTYPAEIKRLFSPLEGRKHLLALSGHLHAIRNDYFGKESFWNSSVSFQDITIGAACGGWWTGPLDERGLPVATCPDGSPNGYYRFTFEGNRYGYEFIPANHRPDFQMRLTLSKDELIFGELQDAYLFINIFTATSYARVKVTFDDENGGTAENYTDIDPFMKETHHLRYNFDNWQPKLEKTSHLWKFLLPENLSPGIHRVRVEAEDRNGNSYSGYKLIEIKN